ncbi:gustatory receptor 6 [Nasonia vitripennis]|uniref:Gustatory receptor n=1 Tax=Nasonia vitripennis TaxID=7425 RepID=A0A7M6UPG0_NASVI|nr:gustatory receptor 6 [Nasonia vitripennis]
MEVGSKKHRQRSTQRQKKSPGNEESPLYEVVCPAVYLARVFGLAPYELEDARPDNNRPKRLGASTVYCFFSIFWLIVYTYIVVISLIRFGGLDRDKPVLGVTEDGKLILNYLVSMVDTLLCIRCRERFVHVWNSIQDFDESFQLGNVPAGRDSPRYSPILRRARFWVWTILTTNVVGWTMINQLGMHAFGEPYLQNIGYMLTYVGTCVAVLKFVGVVMLLGQRFAYLNEELARQRKKEEGRRSRAADEIVKKIESSYNKLLSTSEELGNIYSFSLFLYLLNLFCHAVSNMYFFTIWTILDPGYLKNPKIVFCLFSWLLIYLVQMLLIHVACHFTSLEANRMASVLLDWRRQAYRQSKYEFSSTLHYLNRRLNFTAAGCFNVNLPLLTSIFGHLTTYLVILLQIPDSSNS